jgi:DNA-directed RNA polymerase specialized sigma24 family protein
MSRKLIGITGSVNHLFEGSSLEKNAASTLQSACVVEGAPAELARQLDLGAVQAREVARAERSSAIQACKERGLTQRETADELGLSKSTVARAW